MFSAIAISNLSVARGGGGAKRAGVWGWGLGDGEKKDGENRRRGDWVKNLHDDDGCNDSQDGAVAM